MRQKSMSDHGLAEKAVREKKFKIGAKVVYHRHIVTFQIAGDAVP